MTNWVEGALLKMETIKAGLISSGIPAIYAFFDGINWLAILSAIGIVATIILGIRRDRREQRAERRKYLLDLAKLRPDDKPSLDNQERNK